MPAAPAVPFDAIVIPTAQFVVLVSAIGQPATSEFEVFHLIPLHYTRSHGGQRLQTLTLQFDLSAAADGLRVWDYLANARFDEQVEIRLLDEQGLPTILFGWGYLAESTANLGEATEAVTLTARVDHHLFGVPLTAYPVLDPLRDEADERGEAARERWIERPLVWNPERDVNGVPRVENNLGQQQLGDPDSDPVRPFEGWHYVLDPDSVRTLRSELSQDSLGERGPWTLAEAAYALCWWCNPHQTHVGNPPRDLIRLLFPQMGGSLHNQQQHYGHYLPDALDELLGPHNCSWYLASTLVPDESGALVRASRIQFFERARGPRVSLYRQAGGVKSAQFTNVNELRVTRNVVDLANEILIRGDFEKREVTKELYRAWAAADDSLDAADLDRDQETPVTKPDVGRLWTLNEAGDTTGLRPEITAQADLESLFTANSLATRRRRLLPCLSEKIGDEDEAQSNGFYLEWFDYELGIDPANWRNDRRYDRGQTVIRGVLIYRALADHLNSEPPSADWEYVVAQTPLGWSAGFIYNTDDEVIYEGQYYRWIGHQKIPTPGIQPTSDPLSWKFIDITHGDWVKCEDPFSVLEHQGGILFEGRQVPSALWGLGQDEAESGNRPRLRITATIMGDRRVQGLAVLRPQSPQSLPVRLVLDLPDKFQDAQIVAGSHFAGTLTHARNDSSACATYAATIRTLEEVATLSCSVMLEGLQHPELEIGQLVDEIDGVEIRLQENRTNPADPKRFVQIVGFNYDLQRQMTEVLLETFDEERPEPWRVEGSLRRHDRITGRKSI